MEGFLEEMTPGLSLSTSFPGKKGWEEWSREEGRMRKKFGA